jgi:hypothetical protein
MENPLASDTTTTEEIVAPETTEETQEQAQATETQTTEEQGPAPEVKEQKVVQELKTQRRKRQEAERVIAEKQAEISKKEAEAAYWKGVAEGQGHKQVPTVHETGEPKPPKIADFESIEEYDAAREAYLEKKLEWKFQNNQAEVAKKREEETRMSESARIDAAFQETMAKALEDDPELEDIRNNVGKMISEDMGIAIKQSENAPEVIRYLNDNKKEIERIKTLNPVAQVRELVKIEAKIMNPPTRTEKTITQAPKPVSTVNASKGTIMAVDEEKMSTEEWIKKERQRRLDKNK